MASCTMTSTLLHPLPSSSSSSSSSSHTRNNISLPTSSPSCSPAPTCCTMSRAQASPVVHYNHSLTARSACASPFGSSGHSFSVSGSQGPSAWAVGSFPLGAQAPSGAAQKPPDTDVMGLLLRQRIVFLGFNLDEYVADAIISQLLLLDAQDPTQDIRLFINSPGGSTSSAMAIYDAIQLCRADISTVAFGIAASTAAIVLAGGSKGKRFAMPNTRIMLHQPLAGASGQAIDVEIQAREAMHHRKNVTRILSEITGRAFEQVEKDIDRDRYMSPAEAMEYGILDGVIDKDMIIPLCPSPESVLRSPGYRDAVKNPRKFLTPVIPDDEVN